MKALILAAGRGSRLCTLTQDRPKCLVEAKGKILLDWQTEALKGAGIQDITLVGGYMSELLPTKGYNVIINNDWSVTNMVMSLLKAKTILNENECIISYADIIYPSSTVSELLKETDDIAITYNTEWLDVWSNRFDDPLSDAETFKIDEFGYLTEIGKKANSVEEIEGQYMGLLKIKPSGFKKICNVVDSLALEEKNKLDMTSLLQKLITENIKIKAIPIDGNWFEIDNEEDLECFNNFKFR